MLLAAASLAPSSRRGLPAQREGTKSRSFHVTPRQTSQAARGGYQRHMLSVTAVLSEGKRSAQKPAGRFAWDYLERSFPAQHLDQLTPYFAAMPYDPFLYKDGHKYRQRRLSTVYEDQNGTLRIRKGTLLLQSKDVNPLYGGVPRTFEELDPALIQESSFQGIWRTYVDATGIDPRKESVMVHQIRTKCSPTMFGDPTPEGIHQDGYSVVGIFCAGRARIRGAATSLFRSPEDPASPLVSKVLQPGSALIANDKEVFHFTGMVEPEGEGEGARE